MNSINLWSKIDTRFVNYKNSGTSDNHRLLQNLTDKINLKISDKYFALSNLTIHYTLRNIKNSLRSNKFKMSFLTWNKEFELPDGS